jgi:hypothetical protein
VHSTQVVIAAVVAGIALRIGKGCGQPVNRLLQIGVRSGGVAGCTAGQARS